MSASNDPYALSKSRTSSSIVSSTSVRPRTKRFITGLEDFSEQLDSANNQTDNSSAIASPTNSYFESPFYSRVPSPIPSKHPSRSSSLRPPSSRNNVTNTNGSSLSSTSDLATSLSGIWGKSWTSLQGLASNVLGSDPSELIKDNPNRPTKSRSRAAARSGIAPGQWGPPRQTQPGAGSNEERKALFRARKREELLNQAGRSETQLHNAAAHYKRRNSDDMESASLPPGELDNRDALVYIHQVLPSDTLAGISIKFNCPMTAIKKANGMWSNDGIQIRKTLIIPVDNCNVKGRRVAAPGNHPEDLLSGDASADNVKTPTQTSVSNWLENNRRDSSATIKPAGTATEAATNISLMDTKHTEEQPWTHESWILIEGHLDPIEIARLPRQNLGFFPRARRRSNAYSDADIASHANSLDQPRTSVAVSDTSSAQAAKQSHHRSRRSSSSQDFAHRMIGPGGVGTLKGKGPSAPGPAEDKLTKVLGNTLHLSNFIPARRSSLDDQDSAQSSGYPSPTYANSGLDYFGLAVEGFVRKMTKSATQALDQVASSNSPTRHSTRQRQVTRDKRQAGAGGISTGASSTAGPGLSDRFAPSKGRGDLIELENAFEIGEEDDDHDEYDHDRRFGDRDEADFADRGRSRSSGGRTPTNGRVYPPAR